MSYIGRPFPKIPLMLELPAGQSSFKTILGVSVRPSLEKVSVGEGEIELVGNYSITVHYHGDSEISTALDKKSSAHQSCSFFQGLEVEHGRGLTESTRVYSYCWDDNINTFIENNNRRISNKSLVLGVHECNLEIFNHRTLKGHLILKVDRID